MKAAVAFAAGVLFAVGLAISGMTQPSKVLGFLDLFGRWDPSLLVVMAAAIAVFFPVFRLSKRRERPFLADAFFSPASSGVDRRVVAGAAIFGVGWGASGYCPGPAIASISAGGVGLLAFVGTMLLGMLTARLLLR